VNPYVINITILVIAAVVPVYLIIRLPKIGYPVGVLIVCLLFVVRDYLLIEYLLEDSIYLLCVFTHFLVGISYCTPVYGIKSLFVLLRNRKKGIGASRKKKVVLAAVWIAVLLEMPIWWLWAGLTQCYAYHQMISDSSWSAQLSIKPKRIELHKNPEASDISLGYAQVAIQPELIRSIGCLRPTLIDIRCSECSILFMEPFSQTYEEISQRSVVRESPFLSGYDLWRDAGQREVLSREVLLAHPLGQLTLEMIEEPYSWKVKVVNTVPKTYREVFSMKRDVFEEYICLALAKVIMPHAENGIGVFETETVRGIVYFGFGGEDKTKVKAHVYSRRSNISQGILVNSDTQEKAEKALLSVLASHRFVISEAPGKEELRKIIIEEVSKHDKFKKTEESQIAE